MTDPLETALAGLAPTPPAVNRDRLLFEAGRAAGCRTANRWRAATHGGGLLAAGLAVALFTRSPEVVVRTEFVPVEKPLPAPEPPPLPPPSPEPDPSAAGAVARWLNLRDAVLADGLTALPPAPAAGPPAGSRWPTAFDLH